MDAQIWDLEEALSGAIEALLWTASGDDSWQLGEVAASEREILREELSEFVTCPGIAADVQTMLDHYATTDRAYFGASALFGHDWTLTRNGEGVGFWDRGEGSGSAERLSSACRRLPEIWAYYGDDGLIYFE